MCQVFHNNGEQKIRTKKPMKVSFADVPSVSAVDTEAINQFCRKWHVREMALFGSVLRDDFAADSDIDILLTFEPDAEPGILEWQKAHQELSELFNRNVDLTMMGGLLSWRTLRSVREQILREAKVVYADA